jgi:hypothetical protein
MADMATSLGCSMPRDLRAAACILVPILEATG